MENIDKIEKYLSGDMAGEERQSFEAEVAANPALADEVDLLRLAREAVELQIGDNLRQQFQEWDQSATQSTTSTEAKVVQMKPRTTLRRVLAIAATVLLLLSAGSFWYANDQYAADAIAGDLYESIATTRRPNSSEDTLEKAIAAIMDKNYAEADQLLQTIQPNDLKYTDARYYLGHSYYQQGQYNEAINILQNLGDNADINLSESADWLRVLSYLELGQTDNTTFQSLLSEMVSNTDHNHHNDAVKLEKKINSFWFKLAN
ncbi:MAG: tetratricopeptide repeat protein [Lewinella sp.]|nr:tetratricopeptide repeat protein [Lewinella sp.]